MKIFDVRSKYDKRTSETKQLQKILQLEIRGRAQGEADWRSMPDYGDDLGVLNSSRSNGKRAAYAAREKLILGR